MESSYSSFSLTMSDMYTITFTHFTSAKHSHSNTLDTHFYGYHIFVNDIKHITMTSDIIYILREWTYNLFTTDNT